MEITIYVYPFTMETLKSCHNENKRTVILRKKCIPDVILKTNLEMLRQFWNRKNYINMQIGQGLCFTPNLRKHNILVAVIINEYLHLLDVIKIKIMWPSDSTRHSNVNGIIKTRVGNNS